jgi:hypothetical protein
MSVKTVMFSTPLVPLGGRRMVFRKTDVAHLVPDHDEAAGVGIGQRTNQHRIDGAEHAGVDGDCNSFVRIPFKLKERVA